MALANDLVASGLVASMPHPEGSTTGVAIFAFQLDVKRLELLHEALPEARRIGILADREQVPIISALNAAARDFGIEISHFTARSQEEIIHAIDAMRATAVDAVNVLASPILSPFVSLIIDRLRLSGLPGMLQWPEGAEAGGLIAYGPRLDEAFRQCARQVAKQFACRDEIGRHLGGKRRLHDLCSSRHRNVVATLQRRVSHAER